MAMNVINEISPGVTLEYRVAHHERISLIIGSEPSTYLLLTPEEAQDLALALMQAAIENNPYAQGTRKSRKVFR